MTKGETLKLAVTDTEASAVEFRFGGPQAKTVAATKDGSEFAISTPTTTWHPGNYRWQAWATYPDQTVAVIATGALDLADTLGVGDVRTTARKIVEMIEQMIAGNASEGVKSYRINNRELERYSVAELLQLLNYWKNQVKIEDRRERHGSTLGPRIAVRF